MLKWWRLLGLGRSKMLHFLHLLRETKGATAIEYGLIAALIAVSAITAMQGLGNNLKKSFNNVSTNMKAS
jgi:pilus assembly protein Flp/PilA